ncbi:hypothetical protein M9Y10_033322 [Tritrichomonas musculus]|uniref:Uncharacterized protein n=1 Tax=Tritrichomonas musculus TaxID=1915356 RepID=A0ABR2KCX2_9EUKA
MELDVSLSTSDNSNNIDQNNSIANEFSSSCSQTANTIANAAMSNNNNTEKYHFYGINDFILDTYTTPVFKEEFTIEAMKKIGVTPDDLVKVTKQDIKMIPGNEQTKSRIIDEIEKKRLSIISQIKVARKELIEEQDKKESFDRKHRLKKSDVISSNQKGLDRIQRFQQREIERLIGDEYVQMENREKDLQRQIRLKTMIKENEEKNKQKQEEEAKKRKLREDKVISRFKEKEEELERRRLKQQEDEKHRRELEMQQAEERKKEFLNQEKLKEMRLQKLKEEREKKEIENQKKIEDKIKEQLIKEEIRLKSKQEEINVLKEQHQQMMKKQMERAVVAQKREKEQIENKMQKIEEEARLTEQRMNEHRRKQQIGLDAIKKRNEEKIRKSRELAKKIEQDELKKKEAIQIKMVKAHERYIQLTANRQKRIEVARAENNEKVLKLIEKKKKSEELFQRKLTSLDERMKLKEEKFKSLKLKEEEELQNKAALNWLKQKFGEDNAKRLQRKEEYEKQKVLKTLEERNKIVDQLILQQRIDQQKRFSLSLKAQQKRRELNEEFGKTVTLRKNTSDDEKSIYQLAKKFNIDMEKIKKKYSRKHPRSSLSAINAIKSDKEKEIIINTNSENVSTESANLSNDDNFTNDSCSDLNDSIEIMKDSLSDASEPSFYMTKKSYPKESRTGIDFQAVSDCGYVFKYVPVSQD